MENSFSPMSLASPPVAAMLPAVSEARDVESMSPVSPLDVISCPSLSTRYTHLAFDSCNSLSTAALISRYSSSNITKELCGIFSFTSLAFLRKASE